jgi:hypothetical protein
VHGGVDSGAGLGLLAGTTSGRAGRIASPGRHLAVDGTGESVAGLNAGQGRTSFTAVGSSDNNRASALLGAGSARGRAGSERRPCGNLAINGTGKGAACSRGGERRATGTAKAGNSDDGTRLGLGTSTARLGASTVSGPARHSAINRAVLGVANALFLGGASVTTVLGSDVDLVVARLGASATSLGASGPGVPGMLAVDGARVGVAVLLSRDLVAWLAAELSSSDYRLGLSVDTTATKLRASRPTTPSRDDAVDGAFLGTAGTVFKVFSGAAGTTVLGSSYD